ncbi:MAG: ferredoxin [Planktomarina sp.]
MNLPDIESAAAAVNLSIFGVTDGSLVLLGPREPGFWKAFTASPEWNDEQDNPMDRWSSRVIAGLAKDLNATARFPFEDPLPPFLTWAMNANSAWQSPVGMLVQAKAGLMVSYRGALQFKDTIETPAVQNPCTPCVKPCITACPVGALTPDGYDVPACHAYMRTPKGADCNNGCLVRRACPVSQSYGRDPKQSAYHMRRFLKE